MVKNREARQYKCYLCGKKFNSLPDLIKHDLKLDYKENKSRKTAG